MNFRGSMILFSESKRFSHLSYRRCIGANCRAIRDDIFFKLINSTRDKDTVHGYTRDNLNNLHPEDDVMIQVVQKLVEVQEVVPLNMGLVLVQILGLHISATDSPMSLVLYSLNQND